MSLKSMLALADDKLHEVFHRKPHDPEKARKPIIKGIDRTNDQFASATPVKGRKWFKVANGVVEFTPPFVIGGKTTHYIPSERFKEFLGHLKTSVTGGELDKEIEAGAPSGGGTRVTRGKRGPLSPEALAARRAKMAANGTAKK